jgi:hypothetical protein
MTESFLYAGMAWALVGTRQAACLHAVCCYIDPGTGSLIIQVILGVLFGGLVALKLFWAKVSHFFRRLFSGNNKADTDAD